VRKPRRRKARDMRGPQFVEFKDSFIIKRNLETHELWIVMKHYKNGDLSKTLRRAEGMRIEEERLGGILTPVLEGLRQMHAESMMHRDIKPGEYRTELHCTALHYTVRIHCTLHCTLHYTALYSWIPYNSSIRQSGLIRQYCITTGSVINFVSALCVLRRLSYFSGPELSSCFLG
jgi:serine/threonine protein kinase